MKFWRSHLLIACAASTATALVVGGIAFATIPSNADGSISACLTTVPPGRGQIRFIDHQAGRKCGKRERMISWPTRGFRWIGTWNSRHAYKINDVVAYNGSSYIALHPTTNVVPVSAHYWGLMSAAGTGTGSPGAPGATGPTGPTGATTCGFPHVGADWAGCDFTGAFLQQANLSNANLTTANITNADLTNVNFTGANLTGATGLASANVTGVTWSNTTCPDASLSSTNGTTPESCVGH